MRSLNLIRYILAFVLCVFVFACVSPSGDVVLVTKVEEGKLSVLKDDELAELEEIRKATETQKTIDPSISEVIVITEVIKKIIVSWLLTLPVAAGTSIVIFLMLRTIIG